MISWMASIVVLAMASAFLMNRTSKISQSFSYGSKEFWPSMPFLILKSLVLSEPHMKWKWIELGIFETKMTQRQGLFMFVHSFLGTALFFTIWRFSLFTISELVFFGLAVISFVLGFFFKKKKLVLSWELPLFYIGLLVMSAEWLLLASAQLYNSDNPPAFVFLLGDTGWMTLAFGFVLGLIWGAFTRSPLFILISGSLLLLTGLASLNFLVAVIMGHALAFLIFAAFWASAQSPLGRKALVLRGSIYVLSTLIATLILSFAVLQDYSPRGREFEWLVFASSLVLVDQILAAGVFHFYSARKSRTRSASSEGS